MKLQYSILAAAAVFVLPVAAQQDMSHDHHDMAEHGNHHEHEGEPADPAPAPVENASVSAKVKGMVCDFCARAIEKVFGREDAVERVSVDLDAGAINIAFKPGENLSDDRIAELIRKSGYALVSIDRGGA